MKRTSIDVDPLTGRRAVPFTILLVEDNPTDAEQLLHAIEGADLKAVEAELDIAVRSTAEGALQLLAEQPVDVVLTELTLPALHGLDLIARIQEQDPHLPVLVVTRTDGIDAAVEAMRRGAYDYLLKPVDSTDLGMRLHRAIRMSEIMRRQRAFERMARQDMDAGTLVGASDSFQDLMQRIREASQVRSTVLITGETGTGKGLIARAIHERSRERDRPFQVIDCTTVPEGMVESELFGHVKGAFTGAVSDKPGLIELANGGSVFLDEIGDIPLAVQTKLLRVLEDNEVRPVGGTRVKRVDMRFIAATNQNLEEKVRAGTFRKDLYYRLAVVSISVPPLRERLEDVPEIARYFLKRFGREMGRPSAHLDPSGVTELVRYHWPGNVRELRNVVERALMLTSQDAITAAEISVLLPSSARADMQDEYAALAGLPYMEAKRKVLDRFTSSYLRTKLAIHEGHISKAAEDSNIPRQHFSLLMKRYLGQDEPGNA